MGLYDKFINAINTIDNTLAKPKKPKADPGLKEYSFILKDHFKGYTRFPMVIYSNKYKTALINNCKLSDPLPGKEIIFTECKSEDNQIFVRVFIDNLLIGWIFEELQIKQLRKIEAVYAMIEIKPHLEEYNKRVNLFVKFKNN